MVYQFVEYAENSALESFGFEIFLLLFIVFLTTAFEPYPL